MTLYASMSAKKSIGGVRSSIHNSTVSKVGDRERKKECMFLCV